jgi:hypothetical protein
MKAVRRRIGVALLICAAALPAGVASQEGVTVTGVVTDASSRVPVSGALLTVVTTGRQAITDAEGRFVLEGTPARAHVLRVERYGYQALDRPIAVSEGMAPLDLRLLPAPIRLDELMVTGDARADLDGVVLDRHSGKPVPFTDVTLTLDAVERVGRGSAADESGAFHLPNVPAGPYLLRVERIGYLSQYVPVFHGLPPVPIEVRLEPDSAMLQGLAVMTGELEARRRRHARPATVFDERVLRRAAPTRMRQFLEHYGRDRIVECGEPKVRTCISLRGYPTRPVIYVDGFRIPEPPPPSRPPPPPSARPGMQAAPPLDIAPIGLEQLDAFGPRDFYSVEYFICQGNGRESPWAGLSGRLPSVGYVEIHAYTYEYMERLARAPRLPPGTCLP